MKKHILKTSLLGVLVLCLTATVSAQGLYVLEKNGTATEFLFSAKPKITFAQGTMKVESTSTTADFPTGNVRNLSFVKQTTSIKDLLATEQLFRFYPNPVENELNLVFQIPTQGITYRILDMVGKQLLAGKVNSESMTIQIGHLHPGYYVLMVDQNGQNAQSIKILKQ
jgi:hypothetical protein